MYNILTQNSQKYAEFIARASPATAGAMGTKTKTISPTDETDWTRLSQISYINGLDEIERESVLEILRCCAPGTVSLD